MSWFKIDDNFHGHPKVKSIPRKDRAAAIGLWCMAGSWSSHQLTDGHVPAYMVEEFGATPRLAGLLVEARLWLVDAERGGWVFHDWHDRQPSRAEVEEKRKKSAERLKAWRAGKRAASNAGETVFHDDSYDASSELRNDSETLTPTRPDPTRPDPVLPTEVPSGGAQPKTPRSARATRIPDDFTITDDMRSWARENVPGMDIDLATKKFVLHFQAASGQRATMLSWPAAWKKWMLGDFKPAAQRQQMHSSRIIRADGKGSMAWET